jgi:hypothetical protein
VNESAKTAASYSTALITAVKAFIVQAPGQSATKNERKLFLLKNWGTNSIKYFSKLDCFVIVNIFLCQMPKNPCPCQNKKQYIVKCKKA